MALSGWRHAVLSWSGDGVDNRLITTGFSLNTGAVAVFIYRVPDADFTPAPTPVVKTSAFGCFLDGGSPELFDAIKTFTATGFTLGTNSLVNEAGGTSKYIAVVLSDITAAGDYMKVGTHAGDSVDGRQIAVGWQPTHTWVYGRSVVYRSTEFVGDSSITFRSDGFGVNLIQAFYANGFEVGTHVNVNSSAWGNYGWIALKSTAAFQQEAFASFTGVGGAGDDVVSVPFPPAFVIAVQYAAVEARYRTNVAPAANNFPGTESQVYNSIRTVQGILSLSPTGATLGSEVAPTGATFYGYAWRGCTPEVNFVDVEAGSDAIGLSWVEVDHVDLAGVAKTYLWAGVDLVDDGNYYGGFKEARVLSFGDVIRGLSDQKGQYENSEFSWVVSDTDRLIRATMDSAVAKYWQNRMVVIRMIDDANRRLKNTPRVLIRGLIRRFRPLDPLHFQFTGMDFVASKFGPGHLEKLIPFRRLSRTDFPDLPSAAVNLPVPIVYGEHTDVDAKTITVSDIVQNPNVTAEVVGGAGTTTYLYTVTAISATSGVNATNPADDNNHAQEMVWGQVLVANAPSPTEWSSTRYVKVKWNNVGEQQREQWWGGINPPNGHSRVYGRTTTSPQQLLMGFGTQVANNEWSDDNRLSRAPSSRPPISNNIVYDGDPFAAGSTILVDRGKGVIPTTYVGERTIGATVWQEFLVCGHAVKSIDAWYCGDVRQNPSTENVDFLIPGYAGWTAAIGAATYRDYNGRRYTVLYAKGAKGAAAADGSAQITLNMKGIELAGDGTSALIEQLADQYKHFVINFAFQDWESGAWLSAPSWAQGNDCPQHVKSQVDEASFDTMAAVHAVRIAGGYPGAIMFGAPTDTDLTMRDALARLNLSCDCQSGFNRNSQFFVSIFDDRLVTLDAATLYTQTHDIVAASFDLDTHTDLVENKVEYSYQRRYATHTVQTSTAGFQAASWMKDKLIVKDQEAIDNLKETRVGQTLELWGIRNQAVAEDVAQRRLLALKEPPLPVTLTVGLKGLENEPGDVIKVDHIGGTGASGWTARPLRIMRQITNPSKWTVTFEAIDVNRLYSTSFILGNETVLASSWPSANTADRRYGYLGNEATGKFSTGEAAKRLR